MNSKDEDEFEPELRRKNVNIHKSRELHAGNEKLNQLKRMQAADISRILKNGTLQAAELVRIFMKEHTAHPADKQLGIYIRDQQSGKFYIMNLDMIKEDKVKEIHQVFLQKFGQ